MTRGVISASHINGQGGEKMSRDLNKVMVIGRLGTEPELRYTGTGTATASFRVAVNRRVRQVEGAEPREETDWFTVVCWQRLAEIATEYLKKGARVYVEGRLHSRSWEGQDGQRRYVTEIVASDLIMLDTREAARASTGEQVEEVQLEGADLPF